jgi:hypothetical protein
MTLPLTFVDLMPYLWMQNEKFVQQKLEKSLETSLLFGVSGRFAV